MHSLNSTNLDVDSNYYHLWISSTNKKPFFLTNLDKAFFISILQDALSPHKKLSNALSTGHSYADAVDLLAYSLTRTGVHLLVCTPQTSTVDKFTHDLMVSYLKYFLDKHKMHDSPFNSVFIHERLSGAREALDVSKEMHTTHQDWRNDRYSSIGFYLDDRRGDWMKIYHLSRLYKFDAKNYLDLLENKKVPLTLQTTTT